MRYDNILLYNNAEIWKYGNIAPEQSDEAKENQAIYKVI